MFEVLNVWIFAFLCPLIAGRNDVSKFDNIALCIQTWTKPPE
jgi:hypothetical protein